MCFFIISPIFCRYFFEKSQNCDVHANKNLAKSLNELYTEPAPLTSPFDLPQQEFPLTRSVSTTTEIFSNNNNNIHHSSSIGHKNNGSRTISSTNQLCDMSRVKSSSKDSLNKICGLTKSILSTKKTKSEDELFNEFCQRAGYRPKPKDIYVIESDPREKEKSVIIVDNYATIRKSSCSGGGGGGGSGSGSTGNRRNSCAPTMSNNNVRKSNMFNSNSSLNNQNNQNSKSYPKNMFDIDGASIGSNNNIISGSCGDGRYLNNHFDNNNYFERNSSRDRSLYQSRTLPRDFLKRNVEFADHLAVERRVSASGIYRNSASNRNQYDDYYKKSYDTLASRNCRNRDAYSGGEDSASSVHWPNAIPGSPSSFSSRSQQYRMRSGNLYPPTAGLSSQTPSPSGGSYYSQHQLHAVDHHQQQQQTQSESSARSQSPSGESGEDFGTFDLDKIENERRKSHANLFEIDFDYDTGTAV